MSVFQMTQLPELECLTPRQLEIFEYVVEGYSNQGIARQVYLREHTVKNHVTAILGKLTPRIGIKNEYGARFYLIAWYWKQQLR